jgi:predicted RNase H-like nuclease (RuvC/YqgF family)
MDQDLLKTNLSGLERKIVMLLNEHKNLKDQVQQLKTENQDLKNHLKNKDQQVEGFKNQIKITRIADRIHPEDGDVAELKKKVDEYIREIDKCIAHLSQ